MQGRGKRTVSPRNNALRLLVAGAVLAVAAIVLTPDTTNCTGEGSNLVCTHYFYGFNNLDGQTVKIILGVLAVLCLASGLFFLNRHYKAQRKEAQEERIFAVFQPTALPQSEMPLPMEDILPQENYTEGVQSPLPPDDESLQE